jgi:hypothetical protein
MKIKFLARKMCDKFKFSSIILALSTPLKEKGKIRIRASD